MMLINYIHSAHYTVNNKKIFVVDCDITLKNGTVINYPEIDYVFGQDDTCDALCSTWEESNIVTAYVANWAAERRIRRKEIFSYTLDRLNTVWWNSLTEEEQTEVQTFRQAWLDYPSDEALEEPAIPACLL